MLGAAEFGQGHYDTSIEEYHKALDGGFHTYFTYSSLAAAYALEGQMEEAKTALAEARRRYPNLTLKWAIARFPKYAALDRRPAQSGPAGRMSGRFGPDTGPNLDHVADRPGRSERSVSARVRVVL